MKPGWEVKTLGEVTSITNGGTPKSAVSEFWGGEVAWLTPKDMGKLSSHNVSSTSRTITQLGLSKCSAKLIPEHSIILSTRAPIGHLAINTVPMAFNQGCRGLVPNDSLILKYLFHYLSANIDVMNDLGTGTTFKELSAGALKSLPIPLPPLDEQKRIVSILDDAFQGLDRARENAEANLKSARELFEERRRALVSDKTAGDPLTLKDVCINFEYGTSSKSSATGRTPVLRMGNLQDGEIDWTNLVYSNDAGEREKYMLHKGDVLFNRTNSQAHVGKTSIFDGKMPAIFAGYLIRVTPKKEKLTNEFLNHYLNSDIARDYGRSVMGKSVNQANISGSKLKAYPINLPELEAQYKITLELDTLKVKVQEMQTRYNSKLRDISDLRQSLLQKAFAGELT